MVNLTRNNSYATIRFDPTADVILKSVNPSTKRNELGEFNMKIELSKTTVEFTPEADYEQTMLEGLWRMLVDCARFNQKLVPVGEYVPAKNNTAQFAVEGEKSGDEYPVVYVDKDTTCYCQTCNKYVNLKAGDRIPPCCGKLMEVLD